MYLKRLALAGAVSVLATAAYADGHATCDFEIPTEITMLSAAFEAWVRQEIKSSEKFEAGRRLLRAGDLV